MLAVKDAHPANADRQPDATAVTTVDAGGMSLPTPAHLTGALNSPETLDTIRRLSRRIDDTVADAIMRFGEDSGHGILLVENIGIGSVPSTPQDPTTAIKPDRTSELTLLAAARLLGHPIGYLPEHGGDLVQNIVPVAHSANRQVSTSSTTGLMFHTEAAFHPHMPRWLMLLCLRGDTNAKTTFASVHDITKTLPKATIAQLRRPAYRCGVDESYGTSTILGDPKPVLTGPQGREQLWFDAELTVGDDTASSRALDELRTATTTCQRSVTLKTGDLLVIDNLVAVHGRSPFTARFDGTDRWLQRCFVTADLAPSASERDGRIVTTTFQQ